MSIFSDIGSVTVDAGKNRFIVYFLVSAYYGFYTAIILLRMIHHEKCEAYRIGIIAASQSSTPDTGHVQPSDPFEKSGLKGQDDINSGQ